MNSFFTKASLALALGATALTAAAPADAQRYNGGYRHNDGTGTAIVAGIAGLAIGAALASSSRHDDYYDQRGYYYDDRGYDRDRAYYRHYHRHYRDDHRDDYYRGGYQGGYQGGYYGGGHRGY